MFFFSFLSLYFLDDSSKSLNYSSVTYQYVEKETACLLINRLREKKKMLKSLFQ